MEWRDVSWFRNFGLVLFDRRYGEATGEILLDDVVCDGNETSLADCQHADWGDHNCVHAEDVSVMCLGSLDITGIGYRSQSVAAVA